MVRHKSHVVGLAEQLGGSGKMIRIPHVVGIEQRDPVPFRSLDAGIARHGRVARVYVQQFHGARRSLQSARANCPSSASSMTIISCGWQGLLRHASQCSRDPATGIMARYDDRYSHSILCVPPKRLDRIKRRLNFALAAKALGVLKRFDNLHNVQSQAYPKGGTAAAGELLRPAQRGRD